MDISLNTKGLYAQFTAMQKSDKLQPKTLDNIDHAMQHQSLNFTVVTFEFQVSLVFDDMQKANDEFQDFLEEIGYEGQPLDELTKEQAKELVAEDGFFGVEQTAKRISDFVLNGAGNDEDLLRAGRSGVLQGFEEAETIWGEKLPEISYKTIEKALETIDMAMHEYGYAIIKEEA